MFGTLILKELRDHVLSLRFQAGFLIALVLVSASAFVLSTGYERRRIEIVEQQRRQDDVLRKYAHLNRMGSMTIAVKPPAPLVLVRGLENEPGAETLDANPMNELFAPMDLASIVAVVFSLIAIVLGFDAVNGERERGTLRLVLSNGVRRFTVLAAKWVGGMAVLATALAASLAAGYAIVLARSGTHWTTDDWLSAAGLFVVPLLYTGAFFSLALAFSALARRSSVSVIASVFTWVLLVLIVPNISPYVAARIVPLPSLAALEHDTSYITSEERDEAIRSEWRPVIARYAAEPDLQEVLSERPSAAVQRRLESDPAFKARLEQVRKDFERIVTEVNRKQWAKAERLMENYKSLSRRQFELSRRISYASPLPPLVYAGTELSLAGFDEKARSSKQMQAYGRALDQYVSARYAEAQRRNPAFGFNDFLNVSDRPRFVYQPARFTDRLNSALPYAGMLAAWNALFVFAAVVAFVRFDVR